HLYHDANRSLPPAIIRDPAGRPLHSWRVALLPYLGEEPLFRQIRLNEPWDSDHNKQFWSKMPKVYELPGKKPDKKIDETKTYYQVFSGPGTPMGQQRPVRIADLKKGSSNTILVAEAGIPVNWMEPKDIEFRTTPAAGYLPSQIGGHYG